MHGIGVVHRGNTSDDRGVYNDIFALVYRYGVPYDSYTSYDRGVPAVQLLNRA